jgi:hypothetical protein
VSTTEDKGPSDPDKAPARSPSQSAVPIWKRRQTTEAAATACDLGAALLRARGRDDLAIVAEATAHLLRLAVIFGRDGDQR